MNSTQQSSEALAILPDPHGQCLSFPTIMTEEELIQFFRIPSISKAGDHHNVVENLKRLRNLPRIHICNRVLYPKEAILQWIEQETTTGKRRWETLGHSDRRKAEKQRAQKERELRMGYVDPTSMRLSDFVEDSLIKTGDQIRESTPNAIGRRVSIGAKGRLR